MFFFFFFAFFLVGIVDCGFVFQDLMSFVIYRYRRPRALWILDFELSPCCECSFLWVIRRRQNFMCRRLGTHVWQSFAATCCLHVQGI